MRKFWTLLTGALIIVFLAGLGGQVPKIQAKSAQLSSVPLSGSLKVDRDFGKMPLYFIPNEGQVDARVAYYLQGKDKTIYFASEGLTYVLNGRGVSDRKDAGLDLGRKRLPPDRARNEPENPSRFALKLDFVGANTNVRPSGEERTGAVISYFKGKPEEWKTGLPTYSKIIYKDLWPGIDLAYYGTVDKLKYEFIVHPGSNPSLIRLAYRGASAVEVNGEGRLEIRTPAGGFEDDVPVGYQETDGDRVDVELRYRLEEQAATQSFIYGFEVGAYDRTKPLVLDPAVLVYCGFIGGSDLDSGDGIAVDSAGNAYVTGSTYSTQTTFPVAVGPDLTFNGGYEDAFVAKVNTSGTALVYCGYIGGSDYDGGSGIAVDGSGNAYITGYTYSTETTFPVAVGPDLTNNGSGDTFVAKVNTSGTALVYCGYIGGSDYDDGSGIAVDGSGNAYITGYTYSTQTTFPVAVGPDLTFNGDKDAFVAKVNSSGTGLIYCGYIGGVNNDGGCGIAVDGSGNAYVIGSTWSAQTTFPVAVGPDLTFNGDKDAFVAKVNSSGTGLVYCGYIGGVNYDGGYGVAVDGSGNAYVIGDTWSTQTTFPVKVGPDLTFNGGRGDAFVAKVNTSGTALVYCGYIGGDDQDNGHGIAVDGAGNAYVAGLTYSTQTTFPVIGSPYWTFSGECDAFVAKVNSVGTALVYCGYIGGVSSDSGWGIAIDGSGNAYVTGYTKSTETTFPVKVGPDLTFNGGRGDAFIAKILEAGFAVTSPNGAETWKRNGSYNIKWKYSGPLGTRVKIELLKGAQLSRTISSNAPIGANGRGSYKWKVPSSQTLGTNYKIRITSNKITFCADTSDKYFKIVK